MNFMRSWGAVQAGWQRISLLSRAAYAGGAVIAVLAIGAIVAYQGDMRPVATTGEAQVFEIKRGQSPPAIASNLKGAGLIRSRNGFLTYLNFHGLRSRLKAGSYSIAPTKSTPAIAGLLTGGQSLSKRIIVPEGYRLSQVRGLAVAKGISGAAFDAALAAPHAQPFLQGKPVGVSLEGYLFPDSYEVSTATTATQLIDGMLTNFGTRVGPEYVQAFQAEGLTLHQGLTLASIVEREVRIPADRPVVAQIFIKRFREKQPLGSDVTTIYASDLAGVVFDLDIASPYNTRKYVGLPPGPISNPGLSALDAVARPAATSYNYFLSGTDGKTYYAYTYAEHQQNIRKYLK